MTKMDGHLVTMDGKELDVGPEQIERLLSSSVPFWLDLCSGEETSPEYGLLRDTFQFHPLALEDAEHFGQLADNFDQCLQRLARGNVASGRPVLDILRGKVDHCRARQRMRTQRRGRFSLIARELSAGRYGSAALGWKSLAQDLFVS